ncbi:hypothetical protein [Pluralibacter gergoviae]
MNRRSSLNLSYRSGARLFPASCINSVQICRRISHHGTSQDSRAGQALR